MNGKGDKDRSTFTRNFKENFDKIDWSKKNTEIKNQIEIKQIKNKKIYVYK